MVKYYHGSESHNDIINIEQVGLLPAKHRNIKGAIGEYVYITKDINHAKYFGKYLIELNIPKSKIYNGENGDNEFAWKRSGKPIWNKNYKPEAIAPAIPKKYVKAIIIGNKRVKID